MDDTVINSIAYKLSPSDKKPTGIIKAAPRKPAKIKISHYNKNIAKHITISEQFQNPIKD